MSKAIYMDSGFHLEPRRILDFISLLPLLSQSSSVWRLQPVAPPLCAVPSWKGTLICEFQQLSGLDCSRAPSPATQGLLRPLPASLLVSRWPVTLSGQHLLVVWRVSSCCSHQKQLGLVSSPSGTVADTTQAYCYWVLVLAHSYLGVHGISPYQFCCRGCRWIFWFSILVPPSISLGELTKIQT